MSIKIQASNYVLQLKVFKYMLTYEYVWEIKITKIIQNNTRMNKYFRAYSCFGILCRVKNKLCTNVHTNMSAFQTQE